MKKKYLAIVSFNGKKFGAVCPDFPCASVENSLEKVKASLVEAIEFALEDIPAPPASSWDVVQKIIVADYKDDDVKMIVELEVSIPSKKYHRINITLPEPVLDKIDSFVKHEHRETNRSEFLVKAAIEYIEKHT